MTTPDTLELRRLRELAEAACDKTDWKSSALALEMLHKSMSGPKWVALLDRLDALEGRSIDNASFAVLMDAAVKASRRELRTAAGLAPTTLADEGRDQ